MTIAGLILISQVTVESKGHQSSLKLVSFNLKDFPMKFLRCLVETAQCFQLECMQCPLDDSQIENAVKYSACKCPYLLQ